MLQPVGAAVEKAGGLPQLDIRLDNSSLDRKPSISAPAPARSHDLGPSDDNEVLLELLCDDEDGEGEDLLPTLSNLSDDTRSIGSNTFDSKFEQLKRELMKDQNTNDQVTQALAGSKYESGEQEQSQDNDALVGSKNGNGDRVYENTKDSNSGNGDRVYENTKDSNSMVYQNVTRPDGENEYSCAPIFDRNLEGDIDLQANECYSSVTQSHPISATPTDQEGAMPTNQAGAGNAKGHGDIYLNLDDLTKFLKEEEVKDANHQYEELDDVFTGDASQEGNVYDVPDGGMLSQLAQALPPQSEQLEMEEMVSFKNLPPLVCTAHLGDEVTMRKLADTAASVITDVTKHIHDSLSKWAGKSYGK